MFPCLTAFAVFACCFFAFPASAASSFWAEESQYTSPSYGSADGDGTSPTPYDGTLYFCIAFGPAIGMLNPDLLPSISPGVYTISGVSVPDTVQSGGPSVLREIEVCSLAGGDTSVTTYSYGDEIVIDDTVAYIMCQSHNETPVISEVPQSGLYYQLFDRLAYFIYGEGVALTGEQTLVLTTICTTLVLVCIALPFLACLAVCKWCRL